MHGFLKPLDRLADSLSQLRQLAGAEDDQHDEKDEDQLCKTKTPKHGVLLRMSKSGCAALFAPLGKSFL